VQLDISLDRTEKIKPDGHAGNHWMEEKCRAQEIRKDRIDLSM